MTSLAMYTVYRSPDDHPGRYVVRRFAIVAGQGEPVVDPQPLFIGPSLEATREAIPFEADACLHRNPDDEVSVGETWV